jgi:hypothetical protein
MEARRCKAKARSSGGQCRRRAIPGGFACRNHGGASPWARKKAAERLADLIDPDRALREAARIAYSDITELFDAGGRLRPMSEWPPDLAAAVKSLQSREEGENGGCVVAMRLWDKTRALEFLLKHLGLLKESVAHAGAVEIRWRGDE